MHRAFNIVNCTWSDTFAEFGRLVRNENERRIRDSLAPFIKGEIVDGTKLADHWFPQVEADVFISHSHSDREEASKCAGWLKSEFGLRPFIDSCVWGHGDALLRMIDDAYCVNPGGETYNYEKRNGSTGHVHMMLATALGSMIDAAECVFFIKTQNSITSAEAVSKTKSPWLFFELATIRTVRRKKPSRRMRDLLENFTRGTIKASSYYEAEYEVPLSELTDLRSEDLKAWAGRYQQANPKPQSALDLLYEVAPQIQ